MYSIIPCEKVKDNIFITKKDLTLKDNFLDKYNLIDKGFKKVYYKNNYCITSTNKNLQYFKVIEKDNYFENDYLYLEYDLKEKEQFNFFYVDYEEEYKLFENTIDNVKIQFKEFKNYCEIEFITNDLKNFNKLIF